MKYLVYSTCITSMLLACSGGDNLKISVTDSDDTYEFFAKYDKHKTQRVQDFINAKILPGTTVEGNYVDISTKLDDGTHFELEENAGKVRIKLDKEANSEASYHRIQAMCEGVKKIIQEK